MWNLYRHRKGGIYLSHGESLHSESLEKLVVYRSLYDNPKSKNWVRPSSIFFENLGNDPRFDFLGSIEKLAPEDTNEVLMFAYDAWGENKTPEDFIKSYDQSKNHLRGSRYVLRNKNKKLVAGLNILRFARDLAGIASVATDPDHRKKGYCHLLLKGVLALLEDNDGITRLLLFSEPDPKFYEAVGFKVLSDDHQKFLPSVAMLRGKEDLRESEKKFLTTYF